MRGDDVNMVMIAGSYIINSVVVFNPTQYRLSNGRKTLRLNSKESEVLSLLCHDTQNVLCRRAVQECIWRDQEGADVNLNRTILLLRRKFQSLVGSELIKTVPRIGYLLDADVNVPDNSNNKMTDAALKLGSSRWSKKKFLFVVLATIFLILGAFSLYFLEDELKSVFLKSRISSEQFKTLTVYSSAHNDNYVSTDFDSIKNIVGESVSLWVGEDAISYSSVSNTTSEINQAVYLRRKNVGLSEDIQCISHSIASGGVLKEQPIRISNIVNRYKIRFYSSCKDTHSWVDSSNELTSVVLDGKKNIHIKMSFENETKKPLLTLYLQGYLEEILGQKTLRITKTNSDVFDREAYVNNPFLLKLNEELLYKEKYIIIRLGERISYSSYLNGMIYAL